MEYAYCGKEKVQKAPVPVVMANATAVTPFRVAGNTSLLVENGRIALIEQKAEIEPPPGALTIDLSGHYLIPGFIDLHIHGGGGYDFSCGSRDEVEKILDYCVSHGTTHLLATVSLKKADEFENSIRVLSSIARERVCGGVLCGIHIEGPFINSRMSGAMNSGYIQPAAPDNMERLLEAGGGFIKMMTIAPEVPGAPEVMRIAAGKGIVLAAGHSAAKYEDIEGALDLGLSQVTHIFNAMAPMHHREPGVLTASFLKNELKVHLIADGIHVHPAVVKLLYRLKGPSGIILISDAVSASGSPDGVYAAQGGDITVSKGKAHLDDGTIAGSTVTLDDSLKFMAENTDIPLQEIVRMATLNAARVLGLDRRKGIITVGKDADLVVLDRDFKVKITMINGEIVYADEPYERYWDRDQG